MVALTCVELWSEPGDEDEDEDAELMFFLSNTDNVVSRYYWLIFEIMPYFNH